MSNQQIIADHYAAASQGDLPGMLAALADDVRWTEAEGTSYAGTYVGPDAVVENVFGPIQGEWDDFTVTMDELIDGGDTIVAIGHYSGTFKATGRSFQARVAHVWRLKSDKVSAFEQFVDSEMINRAIRP